MREGAEELPSNRMMVMCHWMGSHFHDWTGVEFSKELQEWGRTLSTYFGGKEILVVEI